MSEGFTFSLHNSRCLQIVQSDGKIDLALVHKQGTPAVIALYASGFIGIAIIATI